jgi:hypothetical protein
MACAKSRFNDILSFRSHPPPIALSLSVVCPPHIYGLFDLPTITRDFFMETFL